MESEGETCQIVLSVPNRIEFWSISQDDWSAFFKACIASRELVGESIIFSTKQVVIL